MRPVLVVGATGLLGSEVCRLLRGSGLRVRGLLRPGSPRVETLRRLGVELVPGDLRHVRSLEAALRGAVVVASTATGAARRLPGDDLRSVDRDGQRALVDAARRGGVRRVVYVSARPERDVETAVRGSGMDGVVIRPEPCVAACDLARVVAAAATRRSRWTCPWEAAPARPRPKPRSSPSGPCSCSRPGTPP